MPKPSKKIFFELTGEFGHFENLNIIVANNNNINTPEFTDFIPDNTFYSSTKNSHLINNVHIMDSSAIIKPIIQWDDLYENKEFNVSFLNQTLLINSINSEKIISSCEISIPSYYFIILLFLK